MVQHEGLHWLIGGLPPTRRKRWRLDGRRMELFANTPSSGGLQAVNLGRGVRMGRESGTEGGVLLDFLWESV
jgi:hypothetical protein